MTGDDWHNYFNETYGADNVTWESVSIQDIMDMPSKITDFSPKQISDIATENGLTAEPLGKDSLAGIPYEQGGGKYVCTKWKFCVYSISSRWWTLWRDAIL